MVVALLKFNQGAVFGGDGEAFVAVIGATPVTIANVNNAGVGSYKIELLYNPPDSTTYSAVPGTPVVLAQANGVPSGNLDVSEIGIFGTYRIRLTVWPLANQAGAPDVDIRCVVVLLPNTSIALPPYQKRPDPLPLTGLTAKPDEMNIMGQPWGWSGPDYDLLGYTFRLVNEALRLIDSFVGGGGTGQGIRALVWDPSIGADTSFVKSTFAACATELLSNDGFGVIFLHGQVSSAYEIAAGATIDLERRVAISVLGAMDGTAETSSRDVVLTDSTTQIVDPWFVAARAGRLRFSRSTATDTLPCIELTASNLVGGDASFWCEEITCTATGTGKAPTFLFNVGADSPHVIMTNCRFESDQCVQFSGVDPTISLRGDRTEIVSDDLFAEGLSGSTGALTIRVEGSFDWNESIVGVSWIDGASFVSNSKLFPSGSSMLRVLENDGVSVVDAVRHEAGTDEVLFNEVPLTAAGAGALFLSDDGTYKTPITSVGLRYTLDSDISNSDPGPGKVRVNSLTYSSITELYINDEDANGVDTIDVLAEWGVSTNPVKGYVLLESGVNLILAAVTGVSYISSTYYVVTVQNPVIANGTLPLTAAGVGVVFYWSGDKGDGGAGAPGGESHAFTYNNADVLDTDPGNGAVKFDSLVASAITEAYIDLLEFGLTSVEDWVASWDDALSVVRGVLKAYSDSDRTKWAIFFVLGDVTPQTGYQKVSLSYIDGPGGFTTDPGDLILTFSRTGNDAVGRPGGESFFLTWLTDVDDTDPASGKAKGNSTSVRTMSMLYLSEDSYDVPAIGDWIESYPVGGTLVLYESGDPTTFAIFPVVSVTKAVGEPYYKVSLGQLYAGRLGVWTFDTTAGGVVVSLVRGGVGTTGSTGTPNGAAALINPWTPVAFGGAQGVDSSPPPSKADREVVWVPGYNQWVMLAFESLDGPEASGIGQGQVTAHVFGREGGLTGGSGYREAPAGGFAYHGTFGDLNGHGPLCTEIVPVGSGTTKNHLLFYGCSRKTGFDSTSGKLVYSVNGGQNFVDVPITRSDVQGPSVLVWTGQNLVIGIGATGGEVDTYNIGSPGPVVTSRTVPNTNPRYWGETNGDGIVILLYSLNLYIRSVDHGQTWTEETLPNLFGGSVVGTAFCRGQFYVMTYNSGTGEVRMTTSEDGVSWNLPEPLVFSNVNLTGGVPVANQGLSVCGDYLVCPFFKGSDTIAYTTDIFRADLVADPLGRTWERTGGFGADALLDQQIPRVQLRSSSPRNPAQTGRDRHMLFFISDQGSYQLGGGLFAEGYMSQADVLDRGSGGGSGGGTPTADTSQAMLRVKFDSDTSATDTAPGTFKFDATPGPAVLTMTIDDVNTSGLDISQFLQDDEDQFLVILSDDGQVRFKFRLSRPPTDGPGSSTTWFATYQSSVGALMNGETYTLSLDACPIRPDYPIDLGVQEVTLTNVGDEGTLDWTSIAQDPATWPDGVLPAYGSACRARVEIYVANAGAVIGLATIEGLLQLYENYSTLQFQWRRYYGNEETTVVLSTTVDVTHDRGTYDNIGVLRPIGNGDWVPTEQLGVVLKHHAWGLQDPLADPITTAVVCRGRCFIESITGPF